MTNTINRLENELNEILEAIEAIENEKDELDLNHFNAPDYNERINALCEQKTVLCAKSREIGDKLDAARGEMLKNSPVTKFWNSFKA